MWIFLPPGGIAALIFMFVRIPEQTVKPRLREILRNLPRYLDLIGFALFAPACVMVLLAFSWGGQRYAWDDAIIIGLLCGGAGVAALFVAWVWYRQDEALIPPSIVSNPVVAFGCCLSFMQGGAFLMMGYYLPLWFQSVKQASPTTSGLMLLPTMVSQIIASSVCGALGKSFSTLETRVVMRIPLVGADRISEQAAIRAPLGLRGKRALVHRIRFHDRLDSINI